MPDTRRRRSADGWASGISLPLFFVACTHTSPWGALKVQSSNLNTKVSRGQVHSLSEGPTRGHGVRLTCWLMHFHSSNIKTIACSNRLMILLLQFVLKGRATLVSRDAVIPPLVCSGGVFVTLIAWQEEGYHRNALQSL